MMQTHFFIPQLEVNATKFTFASQPPLLRPSHRQRIFFAVSGDQRVGNTAKAIARR